MSAVAGTTADGKPFLAPREHQVDVQIACTACALWIEEALLLLRQSFKAS